MGFGLFLLIIHLLMQATYTNKSLWDSVLVEIQSVVSEANYTTWFKDTFILKKEGGNVVIGVPNPFVRNWISQKFHHEILRLMRDLDTSVRAVEYTISNRKPQEKNNTTPNLTERIPLQEAHVSKEDNLNPRYTFDNFIVGSFNELAHAAAQAIIRQPGIVYNPLFVYGSTGHGKTHLIQSIGNQIKSIYRDKKVYYLTSEQYADEYIRAVQSGKMATFKDKYKKYDVIIMDDIQFLSKKEKTQEELFHLFNHLYENNRQIIFSSDLHPNFINGLEDRLKSRFNQGMIVDIPRPDIEVRAAIIEKKIALIGFSLSKEVIYYLAEHIDSNIREIEGVINTVYCQTELKKTELTIPEIKKLIKGDNRPRKSISSQELIKMIADFYHIDAESIPGKTRKKEIVLPRQVTMYIMREHYSTSYPTIGEKLGGRDHTTVIHSYEKIKRELLTNPILEQQIEQIQAML